MSEAQFDNPKLYNCNENLALMSDMVENHITYSSTTRTAAKDNLASIMYG